MMAEPMQLETGAVDGIQHQSSSPILDVLSRRWSPKAFSGRSVEPEKLRTILEAARWAPSSHNEQPWSFALATKENPRAYNALLSCLNEPNRQWAQYAPVLLLSVAKMYYGKDRRANRHAFHDVGLATANLILQATALELYTRPMAGFSVQRAREVLGIPAGYEPVAMIALGYLPKSRDLDNPRGLLIPKNRSRKEFNEFVFEGRWNNPASFIDHRESQEAKSVQHEIFIN